MNKTVQASLFEKAKNIPQRSISIAAYRGEAHALSILYFALGLCIAAYVYFVGLSIMNVIANKEASAASGRLQSEVAALEQEYFTLSKSVTPEMGAQLGLVPAGKAHFVRRVGSAMASNVLGDDF